MIRMIFILSTIFWNTVCCSQSKDELGKAVVTKYHPIYEYQDNFFPHDLLIASPMNDSPLELKRTKKNISIINTYNDGFTGHKVEINLSSDLHINNASYLEWHDIEDGSETNFVVEKVIIQLDANPFSDSIITGFYTLQIRNEYDPGQLLREEGAKDLIYSSVFNGKFKFYSPEDVLLGKDWVHDQLEIKLGIKDKMDVYQSPDKFSEFKFGRDSLLNILRNISVSRSDVNEPDKSYVVLSFIVDEVGYIDKEDIEILGGVKSDRLYQMIYHNGALLKNWLPAEYKREKVKSKINLWLRIKE